MLQCAAMDVNLDAVPVGLDGADDALTHPVGRADRIACLEVAREEGDVACVVAQERALGDGRRVMAKDGNALVDDFACVADRAIAEKAARHGGVMVGDVGRDIGHTRGQHNDVATQGRGVDADREPVVTVFDGCNGAGSELGAEAVAEAPVGQPIGLG